MDVDKKGLGIIFHSGSYDRISHGLSLAMAALALGREVKLFFSYWALGYLKKDKVNSLKLDEGDNSYRAMVEKGLQRGHLQEISELISQVKKLGGKFYVCTNSMALLNIARHEFREEVEKSMGITTFLTETTDDQILFI